MKLILAKGNQQSNNRNMFCWSEPYYNAVTLPTLSASYTVMMKVHASIVGLWAEKSDDGKVNRTEPKQFVDWEMEFPWHFSSTCFRHL